ncbi:MAG: DUF1189 family protein [Candidatus Melainabacteria bacterium]|nr:DUF1189 family protein [Candidatus Melainabacteria bacterium]
MINLGKAHAWKAIYQSWYSKAIYRDAVHRWRGLGFRFLFAELFVMWLITAIHVHAVSAQFIDGYLLPMVDDMPKMAFKDGKLLIDKPDHYQIKDPKTGKVIVNFDMSDKPVLPSVPEKGIFVEPSRIVFRGKDKEDVYEFSEHSSEMKASLPDWNFGSKVLQIVKNGAGVAVVGVFWLSSFVFCAFQVVILGLVGKAMAIIAKRRLTYPQLVRIAVVAMTPSLIIDTCQKLFCFGIPVWSLVSGIITLIYLAYGVKVNTVGFEWSLSQGIPEEPLVKNLTP